MTRLPFLFPQKQKIVNLYSSSKMLLGYKSLLPQIALSTLAWSATVLDGCFIFYLLGIKLSMFIILALSFIFCFSGAVGFLTAVPGGLGVGEVTVTGLLILLLHFDKSVATVGTLIIRASTLWFGTLIGIIALLIFYRKKSKHEPATN